MIVCCASYIVRMLALLVSRKGRVITIIVPLFAAELPSSALLWPWVMRVASKNRHFQLPAVTLRSCHCCQMHATKLWWRRENDYEPPGSAIWIQIVREQCVTRLLWMETSRANGLGCVHSRFYMPFHLKLETSNMAIIILEKRLNACIVANSINKYRQGKMDRRTGEAHLYPLRCV